VPLRPAFRNVGDFRIESLPKRVLPPQRLLVADGAERIGVHPAQNLEELPVEAGAKEETRRPQSLRGQRKSQIWPRHPRKRHHSVQNSMILARRPCAKKKSRTVLCTRAGQLQLGHRNLSLPIRSTSGPRLGLMRRAAVERW
jgi:hypothetical protein